MGEERGCGIRWRGAAPPPARARLKGTGDRPETETNQTYPARLRVIGSPAAATLLTQPARELAAAALMRSGAPRRGCIRRARPGWWAATLSMDSLAGSTAGGGRRVREVMLKLVLLQESLAVKVVATLYHRQPRAGTRGKGLTTRWIS